MRALPVATALALLLVPASGCVQFDQRSSDVLPPVAFLQADPYPVLIVEVDHVPEHEPTPEALEVLEDTLRQVTDKQEVRVLAPETMAPLPEVQNETVLWEAHFREMRSADQQDAVVLHVMYVNGRFSENEAAVGLAFTWAPTAPIFLYGENMENLYTPEVTDLLGQRVPNPAYENVERSVLVHEAGHVLGLVNNGAPMQHAREDPDYPRHSRYEDSVMYGAVDTRFAAAEYLQENEHLPYRFDEHDLEDLQMIREGRAEPVNVYRSGR